MDGNRGRGRKNVHFPTESWLYLGNGKPRLLLITNRKSHTPCQIRWKSLTSDDLEGS